MTLLDQSVPARLVQDGRQVVDVVVDGGYHPGTIVAWAGLPLRIIFRRDDDDACSERVVFSAPRLDRRLAPTGTTTIDLPAGPPGEIRFTCGMGRYRGRIELVGDPTRSLTSPLRGPSGRLPTVLGSALILWVSALPLFALVAVATSEVLVGIAVAGISLGVFVAGCLVAVRRPAKRA